MAGRDSVHLVRMEFIPFTNDIPHPHQRESVSAGLSHKTRAKNKKKTNESPDARGQISSYYQTFSKVSYFLR
jgi:hypothetical protein